MFLYSQKKLGVLSVVGPEGKNPNFAISVLFFQNQLWEIKACFSLTCGRCPRPGTVILRHLERLLQLQKNLGEIPSHSRLFERTGSAFYHCSLRWRPDQGGNKQIRCELTVSEGDCCEEDDLEM